MCREVVSLTAWGATYCPAAGGSDGFCVEHRQAGGRPIPELMAGRVAAAMDEFSAEVRGLLVAGGMDPEEAAQYRVTFDLAVRRDPPRT